LLSLYDELATYLPGLWTEDDMINRDDPTVFDLYCVFTGYGFYSRKFCMFLS
jgi:hypothetical protein